MNDLDGFDIIIRQKKNKVTAAIPQLSLYATAGDINSALEGLERKKIDLWKDLSEVGDADDVATIPRSFQPAKNSSSFGSSFVNEILRFTIKVAVVVFLFVVGAVLTTNYLSARFATLVDRMQARATTLVDRTQARAEAVLQQFQTTTAQYGKIGGRSFWEKVEAGIHDMAEPSRELPEEKRQKLLTSLRTIKERWWPFLDAALSPPADVRRSDRELPRSSP